MDGSVTDYQANEWLEQITETGWISLHFDNPTLGGEDKAEIHGGGYSRFKATWTKPNGRAIWNDGDARWSGLTQNKISYVGVWDKRRNGHLLVYCELPDKISIRNGEGWILHDRDLVISFG